MDLSKDLGRACIYEFIAVNSLKRLIPYGIANRNIEVHVLYLLQQ